MNMPRIIFIFAILFIFLGVGAFVATGAQSWTALIPAILGVLLAGAGALSLKHLKHGGHAAATIGLIGFLGTARSLTKLPALFEGTAQRPEAIAVQAVFAVLCLVFLVLCVKSFIDARKARS
jgi:hypothetical protein